MGRPTAARRADHRAAGATAAAPSFASPPPSESGAGQGGGGDSSAEELFIPLARAAVSAGPGARDRAAAKLGGVAPRMELWVVITLCAAFLQNARSAFQKALKGRVGPIGAVFSRFGFGLPFALLWLTAVSVATEPPPDPTWTFAFYTVLGALSQIAATVALLASFNHANFAVGTAFSKTEPVQAALLGALLLGEVPTLAVLAAIAVGVLGVLVASWQAEGRVNAKAAAWGLGSAALFGISAVSFRAASLGLDDGGVWIRAATTLAAATLLQAGLMGAWMAWRAPEELRRTLAAWAPGAGAGAAGAFASACWFTAMTLEPVAHVRALGQVEILFTFAASILVFGERPSRREVAGVALMIAGVAMLLLATA